MKISYLKKLASNLEQLILDKDKIKKLSTDDAHKLRGIFYFTLGVMLLGVVNISLNATILPTYQLIAQATIYFTSLAILATLKVTHNVRICARVSILTTGIYLIYNIAFQDSVGSGRIFWFILFTFTPLILGKKEGILTSLAVILLFYATLYFSPNAGNYSIHFLRRFFTIYATASFAIYFAEKYREQSYTKLEDIISERTIELIIEKENAEEANIAKTEFLANISHEIRTPLHAIQSFSSFGMKKNNKPEKQKKYFTQINMSSQQMIFLINDLLDVARMEQGLVEYQIGMHEIKPVITKVSEELEPFMLDKNITFEISEVANDLFINESMFDESKIIQVIRNLCYNAIKFSEDNGKIQVAAKTSSLKLGNSRVDSWRLSVIDEGIGIPCGEVEHIFDKFTQSSRTDTGAGGTGLGLAICSQIVKAHHGKIWAEHNPTGKGSIFHFEIPIVIEEAQVAA